ncbi:alpha/beta hydrolase [Allostella humosa]|nr:alpha/beta hydrolase [Stella humosa]
MASILSLPILSLLARPVLAALALVGCAPIDLLNAVVVTTPEERRVGLVYGDDPRQKLDVYLPPATARPAPVIVFVYGGSWTGGAREQYRFVGQELAARGYVAVLPDYRLHPKARWPAFVEDTAAAVAWTLREAGGLGGDPGRVFLMGHSAGAYNVAMVAAEAKWLAAHGVDRKAIAGLIGLAGPYDFLPLDTEATKAVFAQVSPLEATQPALVADAGTPPTLLLHGTADDTVYPRNSRRLAERLTAMGVPVEVKLYPGVTHAGIVLSLSPLSRNDPPVPDDLARFVAAARPAAQSASAVRLSAR